MRHTIYYQHNRTLDWLVIYAANAAIARQEFAEKYPAWRIDHVDTDQGQPEGWN